ncbi:nickel pincer cofactor biosynthesis protein LarC [Candidatus Bathyarchaeota archaeon]|nr:nickel pincer cofactor biosynthesis protein LarC [Candidatus Bathyarchaeota archaeon]
MVVNRMGPYDGQRIAFIDCQTSGISGDMIVAALLDLGADSKRVIDAMQSTKDHLEGCKSIDVTVTEVSRSGFQAKQIRIKAHEDVKHRLGSEVIEAVKSSVKTLNLTPSAQDFAERTIRTLVETESRLHGKSIREVHLHEAGSIDTVADIVGASTAIDALGILEDVKTYSSPVAVGGGLFQFSHGTLSSPAPATLEILTAKGFIIVGGPLDRELSTPTGAAILTNLAERSLSHLPLMRPERIGYGAGENDYREVPNILRIIIGTAPQPGQPEENVVLLETNLDDVTGEVVGYTVERLFSAGARDVQVSPAFGKKSRPAWVISVIANEHDVDALTEVLTSETGTLGVRVHHYHRRTLLRESRKVKVDFAEGEFEVDVKVSKDRSGRVLNLKPEYDSVRDLALRLGKPFREIHEMVAEQARRRLGLLSGTDRG